MTETVGAWGKDPRDSVETCECCGFDNVIVRAYTTLREYDIRKHTGPSTKKLCVFCSHTFISTLDSFPTHSAPGVIDLARSVAWIANYFDKKLQEAGISGDTKLSKEEA